MFFFGESSLYDSSSLFSCHSNYESWLGELLLAYTIFISVCLLLHFTVSINFIRNVIKFKLVSAVEIYVWYCCTYVAALCGRSNVGMHSFSLAVVDLECTRVAHVSYLRCKKHTRKHQSQIKLNRRREILRCFTPCNISVSHALNTYYFAKRHKNIIIIVIIIIIISKFAKRCVCLYRKLQRRSVCCP